MDVGKRHQERRKCLMEEGKKQLWENKRLTEKQGKCVTEELRGEKYKVRMRY